MRRRSNAPHCALSGLVIAGRPATVTVGGARMQVCPKFDEACAQAGAAKPCGAGARIDQACAPSAERVGAPENRPGGSMGLVLPETPHSGQRGPVSQAVLNGRTRGKSGRHVVVRGSGTPTEAK